MKRNQHNATLAMLKVRVSPNDHTSSQTIVLNQNKIAECKKAGFETFGEEGKNTADWIVVDLGQTIVHIMQRDAREMYQLEKLWA